MELTEEKKFDLLKESSGHFLTEIIPDTWWDMSEEEQNCFLNEHACEPYEAVCYDEVWDYIETLYNSMVVFIGKL